MTTSSPVITEDLPSSGKQPCQHSWQILEDRGNDYVLVCRKADCGATKLAPKPKVQESTGHKPVLLG